ncbi:G-protein coupled receptor 6-like isoform X1 [Branchiostoma floridae]|uniref:G-protein coupled receptor 6-like isoform X1 n=2 Tax=Branchiostoma floridae TaxID=7739 RepID=A0A9J7ME22_BRAFL|nr:G-protein coupled receptor 6-like isoform X1 [Branchiostoma floridae]XP_035698309.1 G-protein coupled receptor 6-like isoform X1 [Branchiostoma floridae]
MRQDTTTHDGIMKYGGIYILAVLVVLLATSHCAGIKVDSGSNLNVTGESGEETGAFSNSSQRNTASSFRRCQFDNRSTLVGDVTPYVDECLNKEPPTSFPLQKYVSDDNFVYIGITISLGAWSVVANSLPLAAIIKHEQLHTPVYILMANMAAGDVLAGTTFVVGVGLQLYVVLTETVPSNAVLNIRLSSLLLSGMSSAYSLVALTTERYWFIVHGMSYVNNVTNGKCKVMIVFVWMWSLLLAVLPHVDSNCTGRFEEGCVPLGAGLSKNYVIVVLVFVFIPMSAIFLLNLGIFWCLWKHMNAIAAQEAAVGAPPSVSRKSAITIVIITVVFLVGWMPFFVEISQMSTDMVGVYKTMIFISLNSAINPVIYGFRLKEVRRGVARLFVNNQ